MVHASTSDRVDLFIIDGQNDFLVEGNEPDDWPWPAGGKRRGALYVEGADKEAIAVAEMIENGLDVWAKIHSTMDGHDRNDGSHHVMWEDRSGNTCNPYTIVNHEDVKSMTYNSRLAFGVWEGQVVPARTWALNYTRELDKRGRAPLCLWPVHCKKGTWGCDIYHRLDQAYDKWCEYTSAFIDFISKGGWPWTEHYSGLIADVPDPTRPETNMNTVVVNDAAGAKKIVWCGWAGSHCLPWTATDAVNWFEPTEEEKEEAKKQGLPTPQNEFVKKSIFLEDAMAGVPNPPGPNAPDFAKARRDFLDEMDNRGATISTTKEVFKLL